MKANIKRWFLVALVLALATVWSASAFAWTVNQHYPNNTGQTAYNLTKILLGDYEITEVMLNQPFKNYAVIRGFGLTIIHWYNGTVAPGEVGHACFSTKGNKRPPVIVALWTDSQGCFIGPAGPAVGMFEKKIANTGEILMNVTHDWRMWGGSCYPIEADSSGNPYGNISLTNVAYAIHDEELPMEALNDSLWGPFSSIVWHDLYDGVLSYGDTTAYNIDYHGTGDVVLFRFYAEGEGQEMYEVVQYRITSPFPALTQYGLLILVILVAGSGVWLMIRKRKVRRA